MQSRASCMSRIWIALRVESRCASCAGCAPNAPVAQCQLPSSHQREPRRTCLVIPAAHHKFDHLVAVERFGTAKNVERGESPVHGVEAEVRREVIREVGFALKHVLTLLELSLWTNTPRQASGCRRHGDRSARWSLVQIKMHNSDDNDGLIRVGQSLAADMPAELFRKLSIH